MFALVEFSPTKGGGLSIVNREWLTPRKGRVFWPPYKQQQQFERSVKKSEEVNKDTWVLYNITRVFYESDDYGKAYKKLKRAEETSDLQTEEEDLSQSRRLCRQIKRPLRFEESDVSDDEDLSNIPRPPKINTSAINFTTADDELLLYTPSRRLASSTSVKDKIVAAETPSTSVVNKSEFEIVLRHLLEVKQDIKKILKLVSKENHIHPGVKDNFPVELPLSSMQDLYMLEEYITTEYNSKSFVAYITTLGGPLQYKQNFEGNIFRYCSCRIQFSRKKWKTSFFKIEAEFSCCRISQGKLRKHFKRSGGCHKNLAEASTFSCKEN